MKFYIASKLENAAQVIRVANALKAAGHIHTYDWTVHGSVQAEGSDRIREVAILEKQGVLDADIVIVLLHGGRGTHVELGMAIAADKPVILCTDDVSLLAEDTCAFYWDPLCMWSVGSQEQWIEDILVGWAGEQYKVKDTFLSEWSGRPQSVRTEAG